MIFRGLAGVVVLLLLFGVIAGLLGADVEIFNPSVERAKANRMAVETQAMADKNTHDRELRELEIEKQRALAQVEVNLAAERGEILNGALAWAGFLLPIGLLALMVAAAFHIVSRSRSNRTAELPSGATGSAAREDAGSVGRAIRMRRMIG